jgi:hypothetical protein
MILVSMTISIGGCGNNLYAGTYSCQGNSGLTLKLKNNYTFELINTFGKNSEYEQGKYLISDNNIILEFNNEINIYCLKNLTGKVEGSKLSFNKNSFEFSKR